MYYVLTRCTLPQVKEAELLQRQHKLQLLEQEANSRALAEAAAAAERAEVTAKAVTEESETAIQYETNLGRLLSGGRQWQQLQLLEQAAAATADVEQSVEVGETALGSVLLHGDGWKTVSQKPLQTGNIQTCFFKNFMRSLHPCV
jgi:small-conductance mechanosensitive channel